MAYTRWSDGNIYMYYHIDEYITCFGCPFHSENTDAFYDHPEYEPDDKELSPRFFNYPDAIKHIEKHIIVKHKMHPDTIERLERDMKKDGKKDFRLKRRHIREQVSD